MQQWEIRFFSFLFSFYTFFYFSLSHGTLYSGTTETQEPCHIKINYEDNQILFLSPLGEFIFDISPETLWSAAVSKDKKAELSSWDGSKNANLLILLDDEAQPQMAFFMLKRFLITQESLKCFRLEKGVDHLPSDSN